MKKLIQEKQWAELRAYCLEKLLAGIENAEEIVDAFIDELAKGPEKGRARKLYDKLCGMYDYDEEDGFFKIKEIKYGPIEDVPEIKGGPEGIPHKGSTSTTWRFLEDANLGDVVPVGITDEDMRQAREDSLDSIFFAKMDKTPFFTKVTLTDDPPSENQIADAVKKTQDIICEDLKIQRRFLFADSCTLSTPEIPVTMKTNNTPNYVWGFDEEQHSKRLDEEDKEIETNYFKKSVLYAVKNVNEISGVEQAYISDSVDSEAVVSVNSRTGSNFSTIQVSRMLTSDCMSCNLISDNEPTRDQVSGRRQTVFKVLRTSLLT